MLLVSSSGLDVSASNNNDEEDVVPGTKLLRRKTSIVGASGPLDVLFIAAFGPDRDRNQCKGLQSFGRTMDVALSDAASDIASTALYRSYDLHPFDGGRRELMTPVATAEEEEEGEEETKLGGLRNRKDSTEESENQTGRQLIECAQCTQYGSGTAQCEACCLARCPWIDCYGGKNVCGVNRRDLNDVTYDNFENEMRRLVDVAVVETMAEDFRNTLVDHQRGAGGNLCFGSDPSKIWVRTQIFEAKELVGDSTAAV